MTPILISPSIRPRIVRLRVEPAGGKERRPTEVWEIIKAQCASSSNGSTAIPVDEPPPGEGWLPKAKTLRRAQRGVVPAVAARHGRLIRKKAGARTKKVSDEQRGAADLINQAFYVYRTQGVVEVQDDWIRLVRNPSRPVLRRARRPQNHHPLRQEPQEPRQTPHLHPRRVRRRRQRRAVIMEVMATCQNCHSASTRPTKTLCTACYDYSRRTGRARPEDVVVKHNVRRFEQEQASRNH